MIFTAHVARDLVIAVIGAAILIAVIGALSSHDPELAGTTSCCPSAVPPKEVVTDDCGAARSAGTCRAAFFSDGAAR